jgi:hypothetical protein
VDASCMEEEWSSQKSGRLISIPGRVGGSETACRTRPCTKVFRPTRPAGAHSYSPSALESYDGFPERVLQQGMATTRVCGVRGSHCICCLTGYSVPG